MKLVLEAGFHIWNPVSLQQVQTKCRNPHTFFREHRNSREMIDIDCAAGWVCENIVVNEYKHTSMQTKWKKKVSVLFLLHYELKDLFLLQNQRYHTEKCAIAMLVLCRKCYSSIIKAQKMWDAIMGSLLNIYTHIYRTFGKLPRAITF